MSENNIVKEEKTAAAPEAVCRKSRPLPKIPDRVSSKPVIPLVVDGFKTQKKLTAQEIFQIINIQPQDDVYAYKTEVSMDHPPKKLMTPVLEVDEEEYLTLPPEVTLHTPSLESGQSSPSSSHLSVEEVKENNEILDNISTLRLGSVAAAPYTQGTPADSLMSDVEHLSELNQALMTPTFQPARSPEEEPNPFMVSPIPTMTSFSLTHDKAAIKTFRRMATKIHDTETQFTYAKYLLQLVSFYTHNNQTDNEAISAASAETRDRLQEEAEYWIEKLAKSNHAEALYIKGHWHRFGKRDAIGSQYKRVNHVKAFKCFQQAAKLGCIEAHYELAEYYVSQKEYKKAILSYQLAASKKHTLALYKMANILLRGLLCQERDVHQGLAFLKEAADGNQGQESARSAYDLACIYASDLESIDLERNTILSSLMSEQHQFPLAISYFKKADELGMATATFRLGKIYEQGQLGIKKDAAQAFKYYTRAAEMKCHEAMLELSRLYKDGIPGYLNAHPMMAYKWCLYATENGNEVAEYTLGCYHEDGIGIYPNYSQALEWFTKSASKGYRPAEDKLNIPCNKRKSIVINSKRKRNKRYYEESIRIAELSRKAKAENDCHIM